MADDFDPKLVRALQQRDRAVWEQAYDAYADDVFAFIAHLLHRDLATAEEILQETWLGALAGIDGFESERGEFRGWMFGIARRKVALHFRRGKSNRTSNGEVHAQQLADPESILPVDLLASVERADAVQAALAELGRDARDVLLGKYVAGQSVLELARQLDRTPKGIESLLSRARSQLRSLLRWYFDTEATTRNEQR